MNKEINLNYNILNFYVFKFVDGIVKTKDFKKKINRQIIYCLYNENVNSLYCSIIFLTKIFINLFADNFDLSWKIPYLNKYEKDKLEKYQNIFFNCLK
tara:strand:- start:431 stop:724 length:294 start_codon:yes stop_codon:yes gene_type:complete